MLQILGWLGCFYLIIKGLHIIASADQSKAKSTQNALAFTGALAILGAIGFFILINEQAKATGQLTADFPFVPEVGN
jgi:hypothetical protein